MPNEAEVRRLTSELPAACLLRALPEYAATITDAPMAFTLHAALHLVLSTMDPWASVRLGVTIRANTFSMLVGSTASRKTTAVQIAVDLLRLAEREKYLLVDPASAEGVVRALGENPHRLIPVPEGGDWLKRSRGNSYLASMRENMVRIYDGGVLGHEVKEKKKSLKPVEEHSVSVMFACTPSHLEEHTSTAEWDGGFMNRFMVVRAERERSYDTPRNDPQGDAWFAARVKQLADQRDPRARMVGFEPEALAAWKDWNARMREQRKPWNDNQLAATGRFQTHAIKIILAVTSDLGIAHGDWCVPELAVHVAAKMTEWAMADALELFEAIAGNRYERERRSVLTALKYYVEQGIPAVSYSEIANQIRPRLTKRDLAAVLESLMAEGTVHVWPQEKLSLYRAPTSDTEEDY